MKKVLLTIALAFAALSNSQAQSDSTSTAEGYNRWSIEVAGGINKPFRAFSGPNVDTSGGTPTVSLYNTGVDFLTVDLGVRYMFNPKFGLKLDFGYNTMENPDSEMSSTGGVTRQWAEFKTTYMRADLQMVANLGRIMNFEDWTNTFGLLAHGGAGYYQLKFDDDATFSDETDGGLNFIGGLTAQAKLSRSIVFTLDGTFMVNAYQDYTWDGFSTTGGVFNGMNLTATAGLTFYLGKHETHADWFYTDDKMQEQIDNLEKRVGDLETMLNDSDKDGVPDYLDAEPNTTTGVAVNSKGQAIDTNNNGVPDELESYLTKTYGDPTKSATGANANYVPNNELIRNLINEGYVTTYFDFNKSTPTNVSTEGIDFILTYLRNNPNASVEIIGHADEIGRTAYNDQLSTKRAEAVKNILVKAKIDASRLKVVPAGEDRSVEPSSAGARKMVRRVTFRVN